MPGNTRKELFPGPGNCVTPEVGSCEGTEVRRVKVGKVLQVGPGSDDRLSVNIK